MSVGDVNSTHKQQAKEIRGKKRAFPFSLAENPLPRTPALTVGSTLSSFPQTVVKNFTMCSKTPSRERDYLACLTGTPDFPTCHPGF